MQLKMITEEIKRYSVIVALHAGNEAPEVATFLKVDRSLVYKVRRCLSESGATSSVWRSERSIPDDLMPSETTISSPKSRTSSMMTRASPSEPSLEGCRCITRQCGVASTKIYATAHM